MNELESERDSSLKTAIHCLRDHCSAVHYWLLITGTLSRSEIVVRKECNTLKLQRESL